ncbi:MAG: hypothetical protein JNL21_05245 [Myxococcales bacterium]|nr:hypothetical protein [Myxococcales bacterium]
MTSEQLANDESDGVLALRVPSSAYPRDAVYAAAFSFIDRAYVMLRRPDEAHIEIALRPKEGSAAITAAELEEALGAAKLTVESAEAGRAWVEGIVLGAFGAPEPTETETAAPALPDLDPEDLAAFDDPLGIAKSWEEKHKKP